MRKSTYWMAQFFPSIRRQKRLEISYRHFTRTQLTTTVWATVYNCRQRRGLWQ